MLDLLPIQIGSSKSTRCENAIRRLRRTAYQPDLDHPWNRELLELAQVLRLWLIEGIKGGVRI